jgi:hypothetical protein
MSRHEGELPEDLRDIAARLSAARVTPSRLELDDLCRRVYARVERAEGSPRRGRLVGRLRMNFAAVMLTLGLVLTSGAGVVLASGSLGGGDSNTFHTLSFKGDDYSTCYVEHEGSWSSTYSWKTKHSTLYMTVVWDCRNVTIHVTCGDPTTYKWESGPSYDSKHTSYVTTAAGGTKTFSVTADGSTHTVPFSYY